MSVQRCGLAQPYSIKKEHEVLTITNQNKSD